MQRETDLPNSLNSLCFAEQLTLWSVRYWADRYREQDPASNILKDAYRLAKVEDGMISLDNFMTLLITGNCRTVDIRCLCCEGISADEWRILQSLGLAQVGKKYEIAPLLSSFLEPTSTRLALPVIRQWSAALAAAAHWLPIRKQALEVVRKNFAKASNRSEDTRAAYSANPIFH
ncbi:hypothetical protein [Sneathiella aquimaris]|uniref:hypothetical protein n=1 Tax=Sneathiella aquimaris TaxID=2599305 RepID=UPI00146ABE36|nr:hypothetical protein [Sneathiella aquimaris]